MGSKRPDLGSERSDLGSERPDLGSERPYLRLGGGGMYRWKTETGENCPMWNQVMPKNTFYSDFSSLSVLFTVDIVQKVPKIT